jgi:tetratricopeptide (TPR) repeat protein
VFDAAHRPDEAKKWRRAALDLYRKSAAGGSSHYFHHLAGFLCDVEPAPEEALSWARKDLEVRRSIDAWETLAWACLKSGDAAGAAEAADKALATGVEDPHILYHASLIFRRAGRAEDSAKCFRRAEHANPRFMEFHAHR